jgi:hypothetical protein
VCVFNVDYETEPGGGDGKQSPQPLFDYSGLDRFGLPRLQSVFRNPLDFGVYLELSLPVAIAVAASAKGPNFCSAVQAPALHLRRDPDWIAVGVYSQSSQGSLMSLSHGGG